MAERRQFGFTLIEMLIAIAIFGMLGVASYSLLNTLQRSEALSRESSEQFSRLQRAFSTLERDFSQMTLRRARIDGEAPREEVLFADRNLIESEDDGVVFTHLGWSNPRGMLPRSTLQGSGYRLMDGKLQKLYTLYVDPVVGEEPRVTDLLDQVSALKFSFYHQGNWQEGWSQDGLPRAVRVELTHDLYGELSRVFLIAGGGTATGDDNGGAG